MLNRTKLMGQLQQLSHVLFVSYASEYTIARQVWERIARDGTFVHACKGAQMSWPLPQWQGQLDAAVEVARGLPEYCAISVDGSQIYPDRHQGVSCYLINIGSVIIVYASQASTVHFESVPHVFMEDGAGTTIISADYVNARRQELEFAAGLHKVTTDAYSLAMSKRTLLLFDGALIFWQFAARDNELKTVFLPLYITYLEQLYKTQTIFACYISLPKNKELVNLIKASLCEFDATSDAYTAIDHVIDAAVVGFFLEPYTRTTVFKSMHPLCDEYPSHLRPYFFYLHVGEEIVRIEIPAWLANDETLVDFVAQGALDQSIKGRGYPVVLAEAHEQAVVKGPDRDFFYQLIARFGVEQKKRLAHSQKSMKKRGIGI